MSRVARLMVSAALVAAMFVALALPYGVPPAGAAGGVAEAPIITYEQGAARAVAAMTASWFAGGNWALCAHGCLYRNQDWGADGMTYALFARWETTRAPGLVPYFTSLERTAPTYGAPCRSGDAKCPWSDVPVWDSVAALRDYAVTRDALALTKAKAAFAVIDGSNAYAFGACPSIDYQRPKGVQHLKTLETDSNYIKAALLLYDATNDVSYLHKATAKYAAVRRYFLDRSLPLYSVYVFDDGATCVQAPHRFYASVNGNMIYNGLHLYRTTHDVRYLDDAVATGRAVALYLNDANRVYANLQAENDMIVPLIEAMHDLATAGGQRFAQAWILRNACAAAGEADAAGSYGRFFDGPVPKGLVTIFQTSGAFALAIAAADIGGNRIEPQQSGWNSATYVAKSLGITNTIVFTGSAIALVGAIGDRCCERGHARVFVDGMETLDGSGIWQNKSSTGLRIPNSILFAWRWPSVGRHTLAFAPGVFNLKEGGSYLNIAGYYVKPDP